MFGCLAHRNRQRGNDELTAEEIEKKWKYKYEIALDIAKQEYLLCTERVRNLDDKIEKLIVVAAAFLAGFAALISSDFIKINASKDYDCGCLSVFFIIIVACSIICYLYLSFCVFANLLKGLKFVNSSRMPSSISLIHLEAKNNMEWVYKTIEFYEQAKENIEIAVENKISTISKAQEVLQKQIIIFFIIMAFLFFKIYFL